MPEDGTDAGGRSATDDDLEVEEQWRDAREAAGLDPDEIGYVEPDADEGALLSPYLVLYAGFFLGPAFSFGSSMLVGPRDLSIRRVTVMLGICGAAWCAIQVSTAMIAPAWSEAGVQVARSALNFAGSTLLLLFWRSEVPGRFLHDRDAITRSIAAGIVFLAVFSALPGEILAYLGR